MNFFCNEENYNNWIAKNDTSGEKIFCLNAEEALEVAKMIFSVTD